jgi:hypothetical protein
MPEAPCACREAWLSPWRVWDAVRQANALRDRHSCSSIRVWAGDKGWKNDRATSWAHRPRTNHTEHGTDFYTTTNGWTQLAAPSVWWCVIYLATIVNALSCCGYLITFTDVFCATHGLKISVCATVYVGDDSPMRADAMAAWRTTFMVEYSGGGQPERSGNKLAHLTDEAVWEDKYWFHSFTRNVVATLMMNSPFGESVRARWILAGALEVWWPTTSLHVTQQTIRTLAYVLWISGMGLRTKQAEARQKWQHTAHWEEITRPTLFIASSMTLKISRNIMTVRLRQRVHSCSLQL